MWPLYFVPSPMTLIDFQGHLSYFCLKISVGYFPISDRKSWRSSEA